MITESFDLLSPAKINPSVNENAPKVDSVIFTFSHVIEKHVVEAYDCEKDQYYQKELILKNKILFEGVYSYHPYFNSLIYISTFCCCHYAEFDNNSLLAIDNKS